MEVLTWRHSVSKSAYDKNGNRQCKGEAVTPTTYGYTPGTNRLPSETTGLTTTNYSSDFNGNTTGDGFHTYQVGDGPALKRQGELVESVR